MADNKLSLSEAQLAVGQALYRDRLNDCSRGISDPVITPFVLAMKAAGYEEVLRHGCSILRSCPFCPVGKSNYFQQYRRAGEMFWACPHCRRISQKPSKEITQ